MDDTTNVSRLAALVRQSLQGCSGHPAGPLAAYDTCCEAVDAGEITTGQFRQIGDEVLELSERRIAAVQGAADGPGAAAYASLVRRERRMQRFVRALFRGDTDADGTAPRPRLPRILIAVVGKGRHCPPETRQLGAEIGATIADFRDRCLMVTGGLGGVMEAAAVAARDRGGLTVSILPGAESQTSAPHGAADVSIHTGLTLAVRNVVLASAADAMVAAPGSHGTMQEMAVALDLDKPVWAVGEHPFRLPGVVYLATVGELRDRVAEFLGRAGRGAG